MSLKQLLAKGCVVKMNETHTTLKLNHFCWKSDGLREALGLRRMDGDFIVEL